MSTDPVAEDGAGPVVRATGPRSFRAATHERILDAAVALTIELGWSQVTMGKLADRAGVARQTVYNEIGTRNELAATMVQREVGRFMDCVTAAFAADPDDLVSAIRGACRAVLVQAQDNPLLHAVVSATHGADTELLPFLTSNTHGLIDFARVLILAELEGYDVILTPEQLEQGVDVVVRTVLSHVMQPGGTPDEVADSLSWIAARVLGA